MSNVLVTYTTNSGSTAEVADAIAAGLTRAGHTAQVKSAQNAASLDAYDAVVLGAPMIFGWHRPARRFLKENRAVLAQKKVALFACAMRLTQVPGEKLPEVSLALDENLAAAPVRPGRINIKERFTTVGYYLASMVKPVPAVKPVSIAFFNGKLEMFRLKWWQAAFVMIVVQASPGDYRDWDYIQTWSNSLSKLL